MDDLVRVGQSHELSGCLNNILFSHFAWFILRSNAINDIKTIKTWWSTLYGVHYSDSHSLPRVVCVLGSICRLHSFEYLNEQLRLQAKSNRLLVLHCYLFVLVSEGYDHDHSQHSLKVLQYRMLEDGALTVTGGWYSRLLDIKCF